MLRAAGVLHNKHVPPAYLRASIAQRRDLLSGLLDSDGGVSGDGGVQYYGCNERLIHDVRELACSLGYRPSLTSKRARVNGKDCGTIWTVTFTTRDEVFRLERRATMQRACRHGDSSVRTSLRYVTDVRPVASRPVRCIRVANADGMFLAGRAMVPTHNSTGIQIYLRRQFAFGRYIRIIDPWGEYRGLVDDLGGQVIRLARDGSVTLNPLESPGTRHALLRSVAAAAVGRGLTEREPAILSEALAACGDAPVLPMVLERLLRPSSEMAERLGETVRAVAGEARDVALALQPLCDGDLRGLFDGPTSVDMDFGNRCVMLDLSDVRELRTAGILMACATSFLQSQIDVHYREMERAGGTPKSIMVLDEAWKILSLPGIAEWRQEQAKFSRKLAQQNILIMHVFRDLDAAGDDGDRTTKLAQSLMRDVQTHVLYRMPHDDVRQARALLDLSEAEARIVEHELDRGDALWRVGRHRFVVHTYASRDDKRVTSPDRAMAC